MAHNPADDPLSFIGRGLLESLDSGGGAAAAASSSGGLMFQPSGSTSSSGSTGGRHPISLRLAPQQQQHQAAGAGGQPQAFGGGGEGGLFGNQAGRGRDAGMGDSHPSALGISRAGEGEAFGRQQGLLGRGMQQSGPYANSLNHDPSLAPYNPFNGQVNPTSSPPPSMSNQMHGHSPTTATFGGPFPPQHPQEGGRYASPGIAGPYFPPAQHALPPDPLYSHHLHLSQQQQSPVTTSYPQSPLSHSFGGQQQPSLSSGNPPTTMPYTTHQAPPRQQMSAGQTPQHTTPNTLSLNMLPVGMGGVNPMLGQGGRYPRFGAGREGGSNGLGLAGKQEVEEEISTIFVVGFPDDMQEREFQNMFTFCKDFEAATLKLPPPQSSVIPSSTQQQPGMQNSAAAATAAVVAQAALSVLANSKSGGLADPSLLLNAPYFDPTLAYDFTDSTGSTLGLGGFINPNAGATNGGGAAASSLSTSGPPRRQSIGFAKFKTRQAALDARDALQGRKVDVERASVLKAEMAKKNLHTRRGVGGGEEAVGSPSVGSVSSVVGGGVSMGGLAMSPTTATMGPPAMPFRGRLMDPSSSAFGTPTNSSNEWIGVEQPTPAGLSSTSRPPVDARQEDDLGRDSPPQLSGSSLSSSPPSHLQSPVLESPQDSSFHPPTASSAFVLRHAHSTKDAEFPLSPESYGLARSLTQPNMDLRSGLSDERAGEFSPPLTPGGSLSGGIAGLEGSGGHLRSPSLGQQYPTAVGAGHVRPSLTGEELGGGLEPSSGSGSASSSFGKAGGDRLRNVPRTANPADMNPPINTLYVGNLPTAQSPSSSSAQLEEALRSLFSRSEGYRRLSYRQKTNGPMCFVEFQDAAAASTVLKSLYGDTVGGLVKGGIRLSFSKHPLGQRGPSSTPTSQNGQPSSSWTSSSSSVGSPPITSQSISSPVEFSFSVDLSDGSAAGRHHARAPVPFGPSFSGPSAASSAGSQFRSMGGAPSRPQSQNRSQVRQSSPPGVGFASLSGHVSPEPTFASNSSSPAFPASLSRSPPPTRTGMPTNAAWSSPTFSPFGHDMSNNV